MPADPHPGRARLEKPAERHLKDGGGGDECVAWCPACAINDQVDKWRFAFWHAYHRTHGHVPGACSGCEQVQWALDQYRNPTPR
jgi:hypothetical protein